MYSYYVEHHVLCDNYALDRSAIRDLAELRTLKKLCVEKRITVYWKRKEKLIVTFMKSPAMEVDVDERVDEPIAGVGMMQMQREQMQWMVDQRRKQDESQRRQEEWMLAQQKAQRQHSRSGPGRHGLHNWLVCCLEMLLTAILLSPQIGPGTMAM